MLVSKKQEFYIYEEEQAAPSSTVNKCTLNKRLRAKCLLLACVVAIMAMVIIARSETIVRSGYELVAVKAQLVKVEQDNEQLRLEIAKLKSPQRIQHIATSDLGMIVPSNVYCSVAKELPAVAQQAVPQQPGIAQTILNLFNFNKVEASKGR